LNDEHRDSICQPLQVLLVGKEIDYEEIHSRNLFPPEQLKVSMCKLLFKANQVFI